MMRILITGGTGFIGRALCERLLALGDELIVFSRQVNAFELLGAHPNVRVIHALNVLDENTVLDGVINLAGEPIANFWWTSRRKKQLIESRVGVTEQLGILFERLLHKPGFLINASAVGFYGNGGDAKFDELSSPVEHKDFAQELCADWESSATKLATRFSIRLCILRIGLVIGPNGGFLKRMLLPFRFGLGGRFGRGEQWMSWVHRDDLVEMISMLIEDQQAEGFFNAVSPNPVTNAEFTRELAQVLNRPAILPVPTCLLRLVAGNMSVLMLGGQRVYPRRYSERGFVFRFEKLGDALAATLQR